MNKKAVLFKTGDIDSLRIEESEIPKPGRGAICVRVKAAGIAYADIMMRHGKYLGAPAIPFVPGYDICGTVDEIGEGVDSFKIGDLIAALTQFGGYAQYVCVDAGRAVTVPQGANENEVVALVLNYVTAYQMLHRVAKIKQGAKVLIHSGAGGVGSALLQLGQLMDLKIYACASAGKHDVVRELGGRSFVFYHIDFKKDPAGFHKDLSEIVSLYGSGKIKPLIDRVLPLDKVGIGHEHLASARTSGKLVLDCS